MFDINTYQPAKDLLKDRVLLITGAGDGIGRCAAKTLARYGATVILLGRTTSKLERVYDEIDAAGLPQPAIYPMNLEGATPKDYEDMAATIKENFGHLNGILHNAALLERVTPISFHNVESWYRTLQVNLNAPFMLTQACLEVLSLAPDASVVFTSDKVGRKGKAYWGAYGVSKFAIEGFMQILADELENNTKIRVNSIDPGAVRTDMRIRAYPGEDANKLTMPDDIMSIYLYLLGPDSIGQTGQAFSAQV